jgi:hypothetical protein
MEAGLFVGMLGAATAGAAVLWFLIEYAAEEDASARTKESLAAISGALSGFLGALIIKPEGNRWNPMRASMSSAFSGKFSHRRSDLEKDADDAVINFAYSPQAEGHRDQIVNGWDWTSRRRRARHVSDSLKVWTPVEAVTD